MMMMTTTTTTTTVPVFFTMLRKFKKVRHVEVTAQRLKQYTAFYRMEILTTLAVWAFSPNLGFYRNQI